MGDIDADCVSPAGVAVPGGAGRVRVVTTLSLAIAGMAAASAALGTFATGETLFAAGGAHGNDAVVLLLGIALPLLSTAFHRRGSLRWRLVHIGVLVTSFTPTRVWH